MVIVARAQRAAALRESGRREPERRARLLERLRLDAIAVGFVQELREDRAQRLGELRTFERLHPGVDGLGLLALALEARERRLQGVRRRGLEAPLALAVKVDRCRVQLDEDARRLERRRRAAVILGGQLGEAELRPAASLPQKIGVDLGGAALGALEKIGQPGIGEAQEDVRALHLAPLAVRRLDLERGGLLGEHGTDLEGAVVFVQDVHRASPANSTISPRCSGKLRNL